MSPRQIADDPGRQMKRIWLGPKGVRWMVDWTFEEWGTAGGILLAGLLLFVFAVPAAVVVGISAYLVARSVSAKTAPDDPRLHFRVFLGAVAGLCLLIAPRVGTWVNPLWPPIAVLVAFIVPILVIRKYGTFINWNRPISYWMRLPRLVASGPREGKTLALNPAPLGLGLDLTSASHERDWSEPVRIAKGPASKSKPPAPTPEPKPVKAKITKAPKRKKPRGRHAMFERAPGGFRFMGTRYHFEWRTF